MGVDGTETGGGGRDPEGELEVLRAPVPTYFSMQWAAVSTHHSLTSTPPQ